MELRLQLSLKTPRGIGAGQITETFRPQYSLNCEYRRRPDGSRITGTILDVEVQFGSNLAPGSVIA